MASTKKSALATGFTVDLTALHQYNTTTVVEYAKHEQRPDVASNAQALLEATSTKPQAASDKQQAPEEST